MLQTYLRIPGSEECTRRRHEAAKSASKPLASQLIPWPARRTNPLSCIQLLPPDCPDLWLPGSTEFAGRPYSRRQPSDVGARNGNPELLRNASAESAFAALNIRMLCLKRKAMIPETFISLCASAPQR